jgi:hypothetical protein
MEQLNRGEIIMRGAFMVGLLIVALIIGLLVMKNMGADNSSGVTQTQAKKYINKAKNSADDVSKKLNDLTKRAREAAAD